MTWGTTVNNMEKILSFINTYLKLTLRILWPNTISNLELWQQVEQPVEAELLRPDLDEDVMRTSGSSCGQLDNITQDLDDWLPLKSHIAHAELGVILLGEEWTGKSSSGNTILGCDEFPVDKSTNQVTRKTTVLDSRPITMVDTPGWDPCSSSDVPHRILSRACGSVSHGGLEGPHVILLTLPICHDAEWNKKAAERLQRLFKRAMWQHTILLFTRAHLLGTTSIEQYLQGKGKVLQVLVEKCEHRYHALHNIGTRVPAEVTAILDTMERMVEENGGQSFCLEQEFVEEDFLEQQSREAMEMESVTWSREKEMELMRLLEQAKKDLCDLKGRRAKKNNQRRKKKQARALIKPAGTQDAQKEIQMDVDGCEKTEHMRLLEQSKKEVYNLKGRTAKKNNQRRKKKQACALIKPGGTQDTQDQIKTNVDGCLPVEIDILAHQQCKQPVRNTQAERRKG
ncbi:GTPase IMAP family member 4-like isoform X1 [Engraulis encrasicolus]|uniref:GTPase IMAP family member 4-like isoform X1 n=1 Tax=Engraulis encrasicolus TaxID=184585 RepID=UPI002FD29008